METPAHLTPREKEVLALLKKGFADKEIAAELGISPRLAKYHVAELRRKFKVTTRRAFMLPVTIDDKLK